MLVGYGFTFCIRAAYFIEIARGLGPANYGAFIGVVALVGIVAPFGSLGSSSLLMQYVSRERSSFGTYWGRSLLTTAICGPGLICLVCLFSGFALPASIPRSLVFVVALADILCSTLVAVCADAFQAMDCLKWTATINVALSTSRLIGASALVALSRNPLPLTWGYLYLASSASVAIAGVVLVTLKLGRPRIDWQTWQLEIREGLYFSVGQCAQTLYNDIDKTMLARLGSLYATGIYGAAYRCIDVSFVPVASLVQASYTEFFRAGAKGVMVCIKYAKPLLAWAAGYAALVGAVLFLSGGILPIVLGSEYSEAAEALRWLALLPLIKTFSYFFSNTLTGTGHQWLRACLQSSVAVFNILVNLWIIPLYSWRGAAWSSLASDALLAMGTGLAVYLLARRENTEATQRIVHQQSVIELNPDTLWIDGSNDHLK